MKNNGFNVTSGVTAGVPTAFIGEYGTGEPRLGILLEYDALPGLGNEPVPQQEPRKDGITAGHGCGHNLIGAGTIGAALAIKGLMEQKNIPGTLRVYGAAAEESEGAKVFMAREGLFDDLDAMLHWHPMDVAHVAKIHMAAASHMYIEFKGAVTASKILALTGIDLLTDTGLRKQAKADFDQRTEGFTYQSPIPAIIKEPSGLPDDMRSFGTRSQLKETILKGGGDDSFGPHSHDHSHSH